MAPFHTDSKNVCVYTEVKVSCLRNSPEKGLLPGPEQGKCKRSSHLRQLASAKIEDSLRKMTEAHQGDTEANVKELPLATAGTNWARTEKP